MNRTLMATGRGVPSLGVLAHLDLWDGPVDTHPSGEAAYTPWGAEVERGIGEWIGRLLGEERASARALAALSVLPAAQRDWAHRRGSRT